MLGKIEKKQWVRMKCTWMNQLQGLVTEGYALVMPPMAR